MAAIEAPAPGPHSTAKPRPLGSLVASARRLKTAKLPAGRHIESKSWQDDAWEMYDLVGEQRFLASTLAGRMGQAKLFVGKIDPESPGDEPEPVEDEAITGVLDAVGAGSGGRGQLITRLGVNLFVPGDAWLVGIPKHLLPADDDDSRPGGVPGGVPAGTRRTDPAAALAAPPADLAGVALQDLQWRALSVSEVTSDATDELTLHLGDTGDQAISVAPTDVFLIRIWRSHPRRWWEADSPTRSSLPVLRELVGLTMHISAQIDSRLAGAGLLIVPQSAQRALRETMGLPPDPVGDEDTEDPFTDALIEAMLTPVADRANASALVPLIVTVPDEAADKFTHMTFDKPLDSEAREMRNEAIRRLALGQDAPPELLLGTGSMNHWGCVDTDTEILTVDGWKTEDQLAEGDTVLTLNHESGQSEWQPVQRVNRYEVAGAEMLHLHAGGHDSLTTLNHRWPVVTASGTRKFVTSQTMTAHDRIPTAAPCADLPTEAKFADDFVELLGWFWTEGNIGTTLTIAQSHTANPGRVARIRGCLTRLFGDAFSERVQPNDSSYGGPITVFGLPAFARDMVLTYAPNKIVSGDFVRALTRAQLELFIDVSCQGDGWHYRRGQLDIWQRNPRALDAFELALILSGRMVSTTEHAGGTAVYGYSRSQVGPIKAAYEARRTGTARARADIERYSGTIWCPTVRNSTWLARRGGTVWFTGNSWLVQEDVVTTHIEPPLALICDALTTQYLQPVLEQQGMDAEEAAKYVVWYDVSAMIIRPNRAGDALDLYQAGVVSAETARNAAGFDEGDSPASEAEDGPSLADVAGQRALELVAATPALLTSPGLEELARQILAVLDGTYTGDTSDESGDNPDDNPDDTGPPAFPPEPPPVTTGDPGLPDTSNNPAPPAIAGG